MVGTPQRSQSSAFDAHTSTGSPIPPIPSIFPLASPVPNTDVLNLSSHFQALSAEEQENAANEAWISLHTNCNREDLITPHSPEVINTFSSKLNELAFARHTVLLARRGTMARSDTTTSAPANHTPLPPSHPSLPPISLAPLATAPPVPTPPARLTILFSFQLPQLLPQLVQMPCVPRSKSTYCIVRAMSRYQH